MELKTLIFSLLRILIIALIIAASPNFAALMTWHVINAFKSNLSDENFDNNFPAKRTLLDFSFIKLMISQIYRY